MEKRSSETELAVKKVVITGAESTGKTTLARDLARLAGTVWIPEFAREYVGNLKRPYRYEDVERIARKQREQPSEYLAEARGYLFLDTYLIITRVWFREVFKREPDWLDEELRTSDIDLFLLCETDIPWVPDPLRENPGARREYLSEQYKKELDAMGLPWRPVTGYGEERMKNACLILQQFFNDERTFTCGQK